MAEEAVYQQRPRVCDMGYLQVSYKREDGTVGRRCPAEPEKQYETKGGEMSDTLGRKCLCNGLMANIGFPQVRRGGYVEKPLITAGEDIHVIKRFLKGSNSSYGATEVVNFLLEGDTL